MERGQSGLVFPTGGGALSYERSDRVGACSDGRFVEGRRARIVRDIDWNTGVDQRERDDLGVAASGAMERSLPFQVPFRRSGAFGHEKLEQLQFGQLDPVFRVVPSSRREHVQRGVTLLTLSVGIGAPAQELPRNTEVRGPNREMKWGRATAIFQRHVGAMVDQIPRDLVRCVSAARTASFGAPVVTADWLRGNDGSFSATATAPAWQAES